MPDRPSRLFKSMPLERRVRAAEAFWLDSDSPEVQAQHAEALQALARRLNFRFKSVQTMPLERRARHLAQLADVSDAVASRALIAYHFADARPLMSAFLDALGVAHDDGLITSEQLEAPGREALQGAIEKVRASHPSADLDLYLRTLLAVDGDTWRNLEGLLDGER